MGMFHYYNLDHAEVFIFDDFLIKQVKEGSLISYSETDEFKLILNAHFKDKSLVYISNRVHSFSVNPLVYEKAEKIPNMLAIAVIPGNENMRANAEFESQFYHRPYGIFDNLTEAIKWVHCIIEKEKSKEKAKLN